MLPMTKPELNELVEELRVMASRALSTDVRSALHAMADRYAARGAFQRSAQIAKPEQYVSA